MKTKRLLVGGCSITHGHGTVTEGWDPANVNFSYGKYIADYLHADYDNVAYPGASNEFIFHRLIDKLTTEEYTDCLVGWTSLNRDAWEKESVTWAFNPRYGACVDTGSSELPFVKKHPLANIHSNVKDKLNDVHTYWQSFIIRSLSDDLIKKHRHYRMALKTICASKNINLVEVNALPNKEDLYTLQIDATQGRHPNKEEHKLIAEQVIANFYQDRKHAS